MLEKTKKPLIEATGGIHIGESFMKSYQATWPFAKIEIYDDIIMLKLQYTPNFILKLFELFGILTIDYCNLFVV